MSLVLPTALSLRPKEGSKENSGGRSKRALEEEEGSVDGLSKNKLKKQLRNPHKTFDPSLKRKCYSCCWVDCTDASSLPSFIADRNPGSATFKA